MTYVGGNGPLHRTGYMYQCVTCTIDTYRSKVAVLFVCGLVLALAHPANAQVDGFGTGTHLLRVFDTVCFLRSRGPSRKQCSLRRVWWSVCSTVSACSLDFLLARAWGRPSQTLTRSSPEGKFIKGFIRRTFTTIQPMVSRTCTTTETSHLPPSGRSLWRFLNPSTTFEELCRWRRLAASNRSSQYGHDPLPALLTLPRAEIASKATHAALLPLLAPLSIRIALGIVATLRSKGRRPNDTWRYDSAQEVSALQVFLKRRLFRQPLWSRAAAGRQAAEYSVLPLERKMWRGDGCGTCPRRLPMGLPLRCPRYQSLTGSPPPCIDKASTAPPRKPFARIRKIQRSKSNYSATESYVMLE